MPILHPCPACGAGWPENQTCQDAFHQMLFWENEFPALGEVHHLAELCYHIQHPHLYSPQGLRFSIQLLRDFVEHNASPQQVRRDSREQVDSTRRDWKITGTPTAQGAFAHPVHWRITAPQVISDGAKNYCAAVRAWAQSILEDLKSSGNIEPGELP